MKIAVYGSAAGQMDDSINEKARQLGSEIAKRSHTLITGACPGYPYEAVKGAAEHGGKVIGFSPAPDLKKHEGYGYPTEGFTEIDYLPENFEFKDHKMPSTKYRNVISAGHCDACVLVGGRAGTLNEFTIAYDTGKIIGVLVGSGGITKYVRELAEDFKKKTGAVLLYDSDPGILIKKITEVQ